MDDDFRVIDKGWDALPEYGSTGDADDAVTVSVSTTPGEWLVNTIDAVVVPMSMAELIEALQNHKLTERSLVWRAGMPEWTRIEQVPQLKLAARRPLSSSTVPGLPVATITAATATPSKPPPKPVRVTPAPQTSRPATVLPQSIPSRRGTLPFGLPTPLQSRPGGALGSSPRNAAPSQREPDVLAVYTRPAATISFDLSPAEPQRSISTAAPALETLAPTTTDSASRRPAMPRNAELSVVAASDFRQVQRSSKRLVWTSSLASAAAASLLTFVVSRGGPSSEPVPKPASAAAMASVVAPLAAAVPAPSAPSAEAPPLQAPASLGDAASAKPKPKAKARRPRAVQAPRPVKADDDASASTSERVSEPNPYDVKLEEDPPAAASSPAAAKPVPGSAPEPDGDAPQASSNGASEAQR